MSATWKIGASSSLLMAMIVFEILHAGEVLDRAGNADRDIDFGSDDLAGLADLVIVGRIAGIDRGAARADRGAELVGERVEQGVELLGRAERAAARDDDLGAGQLGPLALPMLRARRSCWCPDRPAASTCSTEAEPPSAAAFSNAVVRTVMTFFASFDLTVAIALPA